MADRTGLEPATSPVTGERSNQLSYRSVLRSNASRKLKVYKVKSLGFINFILSTFN